MAKSGRIGRCMGRVEFRACEVEILDMHRRGYANKYIYDKLVKDGKLTLGYSTFNGHLRKLLQPGNPNQSQRKYVNSAGKEDPKNFTICSDGI